MSNVILITGTSSGVGFELSLLLAKQGHRVYATMRNLDKRGPLEERAKADGVELKIARLDVQEVESITACVGAILEAEGQLDVLVNNAGVGFLRTTEQATEDEIQWQLDVNLMGVIRCTKAVLPHMREAQSGRIVTVTSVGGLVGQPFNEIYCAAKFAVEGYIEALASYVQPSFGILFTLIEPGGISTEFANSALQQFQQGGGMQDDAYRPILERYIHKATSRTEKGESGTYQTPTEVAQVIVDCIAADDPPLRTRTSEWSEAFCRLKTEADPTGRKLSQAVYDRFLGDG
ncbi:MAG: SDR family oxidoreductase [Myxococcota bacterium]